MRAYDVVVIGGGPGGLAAAISARKEGAEVLLIEREARLGGILKQCIHDGFGLLHFGEKLSGPEYVERFEKEFWELNIPCELLTFVTRIEEEGEQKKITYVNRKGVQSCIAKTIVLATGCRERTAKQVWIHGTRPAGVYTAGTAQHFVNLLGQMPGKRCVILGSGDIGLIMARRLTLEGATVCGVYEAKPTPSGLTRNIVQCLEDFQIPLYLSHTVTRVFGDSRLSAVEISEVDEAMRPIPGSETIVECDTLILSVGLIPENEIAETLHAQIDRRTKGPVCDEHFMTAVPGVFSCGNALHVNDLVDYVSESGMLAGRAAAHYQSAPKEMISLEADQSLLYAVPQRVTRNGSPEEKVILYFRSSRERKKAVFQVCDGEKVIFEKKYSNLKPPEMKRLELEATVFRQAGGAALRLVLKEEGETV